MIEHIHSEQLKEDFYRIYSDYVRRYGEKAIWFSYRTRKAASKAYDEPSTEMLAEDDLINPKLIRVYSVMSNDYHIRRYGATPEGSGYVFAEEEMRVDDALVMLERYFFRDAWVKIKSFDAGSRVIVFSVQSFYPLDGEWDGVILKREGTRSLYGVVPDGKVFDQAERQFIRYTYAQVLRIKSIGATWRMADSTNAVYLYHVTVQDE